MRAVGPSEHADNLHLSGKRGQLRWGGAPNPAELTLHCLFNSAPSGTIQQLHLNYCCTTPRRSRRRQYRLDPRWSNFPAAATCPASQLPCTTPEQRPRRRPHRPRPRPQSAHRRRQGGHRAYEFQYPVAPVIVVQPPAQIVYSGSGANFSAARTAPRRSSGNGTLMGPSSQRHQLQPDAER